MTQPNAFCETALPLPSSDDDECDNVVDEDICTPFELEKVFSEKYKIHDELAISMKKDYILSLDKDDNFTCLAAGLSDNSVHLLNISSERGLSQMAQLPPFAESSKPNFKICGLRFLDETPNHLLIGTTNGIVRLFDMRTQNEEARFENKLESPPGPKNIASFDRNSNSRVLCTGTEELHSSVHLMFYDLRERKHMGAYFDSHQDDVTTLRFHPQNPDILSSGSTDGLINIFDLKEPNEDDALQTTINTESSAHRINWHKNIYGKDIISCITHTNDLKLYESGEGDLIADFERDKITEVIKRKTPANCNLIDVHNTSDGSIFLLSGSNIHKGEIVRSLILQNKLLQPFAVFDENKQIVRESILDSKSNVLITAGEGGFVTLWTPQASANTNQESSKLKIKKSKGNKATPY